MSDKLAIGAIVWCDLPVEDAPGIRDFYSDVIGWQAVPHNMGDSRFCVIQDPAGPMMGLGKLRRPTCANGIMSVGRVVLELRPLTLARTHI